MRAQRRSSCLDALGWLEDDGFVPLTVSVRNIRTGQLETITLNSTEVFGEDADSLKEQELQTLNMMLFVKDWYNVSGRAYHELAKVCKEMPRLYRG